MAGSSSYPSQMGFDTFLSFNRDEEDDNYRSFIKGLYETLCEWGMKVFMDGDETKKVFIDEDNMSDKIVKAIEESKACIVFLSKGYASSKWCLRELVKIMDQKGETACQVLPLFYEDENHSKVPRGSRKFYDQYREALSKLIDSEHSEQKKEYMKEFKGWRVAMTRICTLSGVYIPPRIFYKVIDTKRITKMIFDKLLNLKLEAKNRNLFEIPLRLRTMEMFFGLTSCDIRFIGIVGMGGIGKTTIAQLLYHQFANKFLSSCFLHIVGRNIVALQQQLLSQLDFTNAIQIADENHGVKLIKLYLRSHQRVLLVLDGISDQIQLEMLAGTNWFGKGSRIIITTRNKDILHLPQYKDKVQEYNVELLSDTSAFSLFCKHAFGDHEPPTEDLKDLCNEIIKKAGRLPLALEKIASSLNGQGIDVWEDTLKSFHKVVYDNIFSDVLKLSYEGLEVESQQIFLDLACFFNGEKVDRVIGILEGFGYSSPHSKVQLLADRCLIDILDEQIQIHISILYMGQEIVHQEMGTRKQTRIWQREDARRLFHENYELKYIQGIVMDLEEEEELVLEAKTFADMSELKILQINNVQISEDIESLSNKLTLFNWPGYPSKYLPLTFQPPPLLELHLLGSNVERLWNGRKKFENLKEIDASDSKYLVDTPDFSEVPNLRRLILRNCGRLHEVHSSINSLEHLVLLDLEGCISFKSFSSAITCKRLKTLLLSNSGLEFFPEFGWCMKNLVELHVDGTSINQLSPSITHLIGLVLLNLKNCIRLSNLPTEIGSLSSLKTLILNGCKNLTRNPPSLGNVEPLEELDIGGTSISVIPFLENLRILNCERLKSNIWHSLVGLGRYFRSLKDLNLSNCNLVDGDIPNDLYLFSSLEILDLSSNHFERLSESIGQLINLKAIYLNDCHKLKQVSGLPRRLRYVAGQKSLNMLRSISQGSSANTKSYSLSYLLCNPPLIPLVPSCPTLVGTENQVEKVCNLLDLERSDDVLIVGIFGLGGIGKTSIAEVVFNKIADKFVGSCFIYISKQKNLVSLQNQMLSQLLSKEIRIWDDDRGEQVVKDLLIDRKVLIVIDGVDERKQIEKVVGSPDWFKPGSRVIITGRNRDVLHQLDYEDKVQEYNVELLSHESAYSLFCKNAFGDGPSDKNELCNEIVEKVGRLPLALRTIGSYLYNKDLDVWNETMKRLDEVEQEFFNTILQRSQKKITPTLGEI